MHATRSLEAAKRGSMRRGREFQQLDLGYPGSSLAMEKPERSGSILAGDRAPDAPVRGAAGQPTRLFALFQGPHWTLLGYDVDRISIVSPRTGLRSHTIGPRGDIIDDGGHMRDAYGVSPGDLVLVRPDGYVGAVVSAGEVSALCHYLTEVGVAALR